MLDRAQGLDPAVERVILRCLRGRARAAAALGRSSRARRCRAAIRWRRRWPRARRPRPRWWRPPAARGCSPASGPGPCSWACSLSWRCSACSGRPRATSASPPWTADPRCCATARASWRRAGPARRRGATARPGSTRNYDLIRWLADNLPSTEWRHRLASIGPPVMLHLRRSPEPLVTADPDARVDDENPSPTEPGMVHVAVDGRGRLARLDVVPPRWEPAAAPEGELSWEGIVQETGLDLARSHRGGADLGAAGPFRRTARVDRDGGGAPRAAAPPERCCAAAGASCTSPSWGPGTRPPRSIRWSAGSARGSAG